MDKQNILTIEKIIGYKFRNKNLLTMAFTHSSYANLSETESNERLEFLGDTVLGVIISEQIYFDMSYEEGQLSKLRSRIVSEKPLAELSEKLGIDKFLIIGNGSGNAVASIAMKADLLEALIGAIFVDGGIGKAKRFVLTNFKSTIKNAEKLENLDDSKSRLQEKFSNNDVRYIAKKSGSEHNPTFVVKVYVDKVCLGNGTAGSKRQAEQHAAAMALKNITKV